MLYAINVLKKIIMKEKSYILFWKVKKKSEYWNMYVCKVHPELCFVWWNLSATTALNFLIPVFSTAAIVLLCYALSSIFSNHSNQQQSFKPLPKLYHLRKGCLLLKVYVFLLESFAQLP